MDEHIGKIKSFGALGYDAHRIADLLGLDAGQRNELLMRLNTPTDSLTIAYEQGRAIGEYNIDVELTKMAERGDGDSAILLAERAKKREVNDLKKRLFGI